MGRLRNNLPMKENRPSPGKEVNDLEASNLPEQEFRVMIMGWLKRMEDKFDNMSKTQEEIKKNQEDLKKNQEEMKVTQEEMKNEIASMKNSIESIKSRLEEAEDRISELEDKMEKNTQLEKLLEKKIKKQEESLRELWDNTKQNNIRIIGVPEGKETDQDMEKVFQEIMTENFSEIEKKKPTQIQDARRVPNKMNPQRSTPRHIIIKLAKNIDKTRILKAARERQKVTYKGTPIRLATDFSTETHQARREWDDIYKVMQRKGLNPRILYPARLSIKIEDVIRSFTDKNRLKEFISNKPAMQEMLKGLL